jgi:hypothetical protein
LSSDRHSTLAILARASRSGTRAWERAAHPVRLDEASFTRDFAVFVRYHFDVLRKIPARHPSPPALTLKELDEFLSHTGERYRVAWLS